METTIAIIIFSILLLTLLGCLFVIINDNKRTTAYKKSFMKIHGLLSNAVKYTETIVYNVKDRRTYNAYGSDIPDGGYSVEETNARVHPDDLPNNNRVALELASGRRDKERMTFRWNKGTLEKPEWATYRAFCSAEKDANGQVSNIFYSFYNVTEEVKKKEKVDRLMWIFKQIFEKSAAGQAYYAPDGKLMHANSKMVELYTQVGTEEQFRNTNFYDKEPMKGVLTPKNLDTFHVCSHFPRLDGSEDLYIELKAYPIYDSKGTLLFISTFVMDVTQSRNIYLEARDKRRNVNEQNKKAQRYAKQYAAMMTNGNMAMWKIDWEKNRFILTQDFFNEYDGTDVDEYANKLTDETRPLYLAGLKKIREGWTEPMKLTLHLNSHANGNSDKWIMVSAVPTVPDAKGRMQYFGLQRDITDLKLVEQQLMEETERANNSSVTKSHFLANMSHEIRTPLNSIVGFSELLDAVGEEEKVEFVNIIKRNSEVLLRLINDILELSTVDNGGLKSEPVKADFAKAFSNIYQSLKQRLTTPEVKVIMENPYDSLIINVDVDRMQQVITNFANNASKYTKEGHIKIGYTYDNGMLYMYCEDTGAGIPADKHEVIFDRFVKLNSFVQGTGLGLSICKAIADGCGGSIGVESEVGKGVSSGLKYLAYD